MIDKNIVRQKKGGGRRFAYDPALTERVGDDFWNFWEIRCLKTDKTWPTGKAYEASIAPKPKPKPVVSKTTKAK